MDLREGHNKRPYPMGYLLFLLLKVKKYSFLWNLEKIIYEQQKCLVAGSEKDSQLHWYSLIPFLFLEKSNLSIFCHLPYHHRKHPFKIAQSTPQCAKFLSKFAFSVSTRTFFTKNILWLWEETKVIRFSMNEVNPKKIGHFGS